MSAPYFMQREASRSLVDRQNTEIDRQEERKRERDREREREGGGGGQKIRPMCDQNNYVIYRLRFRI